MNVGLLTEMMNIGGAATFVLRRARWLQMHGHRAVVFSSGGPLVEELAASGAVHVEIPSFRPGVAFTPEQLACDGSALYAVSKRYGLEALVAQAQWPFPLACASAPEGVPVFWELLSQVYWVPKTPRALEYVRDAYANRRILSTGVAASLAFSREYGLPADLPAINVAIDPPAPPARPREAVRGELGVPNDAFVILCVARLDRDRAPMIPHLADAVHALRAEAGDVRLVVVGDGTEGQGLRERIGDRAVFTGFRRDLPDFYAAADLLVSEGSVVQEAAAAGLPCVVTNSTMYPDRADCAFSIFGLHLTDHLFVMPNSVISPAPLTEALRLLLGDRERLAEIGAAGKRCVEQYWDIDALMAWQLEYWSGREPASPPLATAQQTIEITGGLDDDADYAAHLLRHEEHSERLAVRARVPLPWNRFFSMPLENAQALSRASWRCIIDAGAAVPLTLFRGELQKIGLPPVDPHGEVNFGKPAAAVRLCVVLSSEETRAMRALQHCGDSLIVAWQPDAFPGDDTLVKCWQSVYEDQPNRARFLCVQGPIPWSVMGRLLRGAGTYMDSGAARLDDRRELARQMGLQVAQF